MSHEREEIEKVFADLKAVLKKHDAYLTVYDHWTGYAECGEDLRITINQNNNYEEIQVEKLDENSIAMN